MKSITCVVCGRNQPLNQHHIVPKRMGGIGKKGVESETLTLCGTGNHVGFCHGAAHGGDLKFSQDADGVWRFSASVKYSLVLNRLRSQQGLPLLKPLTWYSITITEE